MNGVARCYARRVVRAYAAGRREARREICSSPILEFFDKQIRQAETAWSVGSFGAVAEFIRDSDEPVTFQRSDVALAAVTARGGVRVSAQAALRAIASESPTAEDWNHRVALCLSRELCGMNNRRELTEIGPDTEALRPQERDGILFDLGLGLLQVDAFVRTTDPAVAAALRRHIGKSVFATDSGAMGVIVHANPHRVFVNRVARIEVFNPYRRPAEKALMVRTRMFFRSYSRTGEPMRRRSLSQAAGSHARIAIRPTRCAMVKGALVRLMPGVIFAFHALLERFWRSRAACAQKAAHSCRHCGP